MQRVLSLILGGGRGTRLYPLTKFRAKPAIPIGGSYRLIDIPISNCINSHIDKIFILTQYNSIQLNRHINLTYRASAISPGFVESLPAQQTADCPEWFQGTADAVRQYINYFDNYSFDDYLILSGDHMYCMDYEPFIRHHRNVNADITISVIHVPKSQACRYGLMRIDPVSGKVLEFAEKPDENRLSTLQNEITSPKRPAKTAVAGEFIASMGVYIFKKSVLEHILRSHPHFCDFGCDVIPHSVGTYNVFTFLFNNFWQDIGTIGSYYHTSMMCLENFNSIFNCYNPNTPLFTRQRFLPPPHIDAATIKQSKICDGVIIQNASISKSIIGIRTYIGSNVKIENSIVQGAHVFQTDEQRAADETAGRPPLGIGNGCIIKNAIIDNDARIGRHVKILNKENIDHLDREDHGYVIRDKIVVVMEKAVIRDNTEI